MTGWDKGGRRGEDNNPPRDLPKRATLDLAYGSIRRAVTTTLLGIHFRQAHYLRI